MLCQKKLNSKAQEHCINAGIWFIFWVITSVRPFNFEKHASDCVAKYNDWIYIYIYEIINEF